MSNVLEGTWSRICDYIFPVFCISCEQEGEIVCANCQNTLEVTGVFCCPVCHVERMDGSCCDICRDKTPLTRHVAMMPLTEASLLHQIIHLYKYDCIEGLESTFEFFITRFLDMYQFSSVDYIAPVPLHKKRYVERGFNQSERIARILSIQTGIPFLDPLKRTRNTMKQATLDRHHRELNVSNAFVVKKDFIEIISGKNIMLIDDVYTTGSTLRECASALTSVGVSEITGWSIARG